MEYDATTRTESMPMSLRNNKTYVHICGEIGSDDGPTHVVTSVEYGMKAIFVYERVSKVCYSSTKYKYCMLTVCA